MAFCFLPWELLFTLPRLLPPPIKSEGVLVYHEDGDLDEVVIDTEDIKSIISNQVQIDSKIDAIKSGNSSTALIKTDVGSKGVLGWKRTSTGESMKIDSSDFKTILNNQKTICDKLDGLYEKGKTDGAASVTEPYTVTFSASAGATDASGSNGVYLTINGQSFSDSRNSWSSQGPVQITYKVNDEVTIVVYASNSFGPYMHDTTAYIAINGTNIAYDHHHSDSEYGCGNSSVGGTYTYEFYKTMDLHMRKK